MVVDENSRAVPLATEEAADIIDNGDPIWCPSGAAPKPGLGGCTATYANLYSLIDAYDNNIIAEPTKNGVIWITGYLASGGSNDSSPSLIHIDGNNASLGTWKNFTLTINGGWLGCNPTCVSTLNANDPSVLTQKLLITNWNNSITINNIMINGASGGSDAGLLVTTMNNIVLNNVDVWNNTVGGANLSNTPGDVGTVTINASTFNDNAGIGLAVYSDRAISLKNVSANGNEGTGAYLDNSTASPMQPVTLSSVNDFNFNGGAGLIIDSRGAITLSNVTAIYNEHGYGVFLDNCHYSQAITGVPYQESLR